MARKSQDVWRRLGSISYSVEEAFEAVWRVDESLSVRVGCKPEGRALPGIFWKARYLQISGQAKSRHRPPGNNLSSELFSVHEPLRGCSAIAEIDLRTGSTLKQNRLSRMKLRPTTRHVCLKYLLDAPHLRSQGPPGLRYGGHHLLA